MRHTSQDSAGRAGGASTRQCFSSLPLEATVFMHRYSGRDFDAKDSHRLVSELEKEPAYLELEDFSGV